MGALLGQIDRQAEEGHVVAAYGQGCHKPTLFTELIALDCAEMSEQDTSPEAADSPAEPGTWKSPWPLVAVAIPLLVALTWAILVPSPTNEVGDPAAGRAVFARCQACHGVDGRGMPGYAPALAGNPAVRGDARVLVDRVLAGGNTSIGKWSSVMPGFAQQLNDQEVAAVVSFIRSAWGDAAGVVDTAFIHERRSHLGK
jgi:mono/diheme cytochrome c family protein